MPDWKELIRRRMQAPPRAQTDEVVEELSTHLEETYNELIDCGYAAQAAFERTLQEVDDWDVLCRRIYRTREMRNPINSRVGRLWLLAAVIWLGASLSVMVLQPPDRLQPYLILFYLPWLAALPLVCAAAAYLEQRANPRNDRSKRLWLSVTVTWLGAILSLMVLDRADHPSLVLRRPIPVVFPSPWLATLVLVGAAGAYLAQRADAPRKTRLLVATSPALLLGIVMLLLLPWRFAEGYRWALTFFAIDAESSVVVPGLALLLGALPFLRQPSANSFPLSKDDAHFDGPDGLAGVNHA
jgi:hypothetical protein